MCKYFILFKVCLFSKEKYSEIIDNNDRSL